MQKLHLSVFISGKKTQLGMALGLLLQQLHRWIMQKSTFMVSNKIHNEYQRITVKNPTFRSF